jgi:hypothetical protein
MDRTTYLSGWRLPDHVSSCSYQGLSLIFSLITRYICRRGVSFLSQYLSLLQAFSGLLFVGAYCF